MRGLKASGIKYGVIAGVDAWKDAGLPISEDAAQITKAELFLELVFLGVDKFREAIHLIDEGKTRRLGSTSVIRTWPVELAPI